MSTLDITPLRSLVTVASFGGVHRAAKALDLSQPAVTGHLRRLEREIGVELVRRSGRSLELTPSGEMAVREARKVLAAHDRAVAQLQGHRRPNEFVIAATEYATETILAPLVTTIKGDLPHAQVSLRFHRSRTAGQLVHSGEVDFALTVGLADKGTYRVGELPLCWFRPAGRKTRKDSGNVPLVMFRPPCLIRERILTRIPDNAATIVRECDDLAGIVTALRQEDAVTALPILCNDVAGIEITDGFPPLGSVSLGILVRDERYRPLAQKAGATVAELISRAALHPLKAELVRE